MNVIIALRSVAVASLVSIVGCVASPADETETASTEQAAKPAACTGVCIEGYVFNPNTCQCQAACTTTAQCVSGYSWDPLRCRCVRNH